MSEEDFDRCSRGRHGPTIRGRPRRRDSARCRDSPVARRRPWREELAPGWRALPGVVLTTAFSDAIDAGADVAGHPATRQAFEQAKATRASAGCPELVGGGGHGHLVDGGSVRVGHRHQRLRRVRDSSDCGAGLAAASRGGRASDRRSRPAADRAGLRRRHVRRRSGDRSHRPAGGQRRARRARAAGER